MTGRDAAACESLMSARPALDLTLYLVVGGDAVGARKVEDVVAAALRGGVTVVQLREKAMPDAEMTALARRLKALVAPFGVPLIVNDRIAVAQAVGAAGVHLGWDDESAPAARARLGEDALIGLSAGTAEEAARVDRALADYVGIGSVYPTPTKPDAGPAIGIAGLRAVHGLLPLPAVAIGGIGIATAAEVMAGSTVDGIAVVSAICAAPDPEAAARALRAEIDRGRAARPADPAGS